MNPGVERWGVADRGNRRLDALGEVCSEAGSLFVVPVSRLEKLLGRGAPENDWQIHLLDRDRALIGLPGVLILIVGLVAAGLTLMLGVSGVIWGAAQAGADHNRAHRLDDERALLLREADASQLGLPALITLASF